ncbi:MAG: ABC transporter substrate-binding protein [Pseudomonadota bacterium]
MAKFIKIFVSFLLAVLIVGGFIWRTKQTPHLQPDAKVLAITQIVTHPALDSVREGLLKSLTAAGWHEGKNLRIIYDNAHGNIAMANQIAHKFAGLQADVIVAIATPSAQAVISATRGKDVPVVFAAVSDPLGANLVPNLERPGDHITGTSDHPPVAKQISLIAEFLPDKKSLVIGMIHNAGEANSANQVAIAKQIATQRGITILARSVDNATKVTTAVHSLVGNVDALYLPLDNTVASALPSVFEASLHNPQGKQIPVFASDPEVVKSGALATVGFSHYHEGKLTGTVVSRILSGESPGEIAVETPHPAMVYINLKAAKKLGIKIPEAVRNRAAKVYR